MGGQSLGGKMTGEDPLSPATLRQRRLASLERGSINQQPHCAIEPDDSTESDQDDADLKMALAMSLEFNNNDSKQSTKKGRKPRKISKQQDDVIDLCESDSDSSGGKRSPVRKVPRKAHAKPLKPKSPPRKATPKTPVAKASRTSSSPSSEPFQFAVASYNIWFGPPHPAKRMGAITDALIKSAEDLPLFVGFQEVTPQLSQMLFPLLESLGYQNICQDLTGIGYGCSISIQNSCKIIGSGYVPYEKTVMGRGIVWVLAEIKDSGKEMLFTTTHLESFMRDYPTRGQTYDGVKEREQQVMQLKHFCEDCLEKRPSVATAVITGDLNWDDERKRSGGADKPLLSLLGKGWCDTWKEIHPSKDGYTYDSKESQMLKGNLRRRFDRCLVFRKESKEISIQQADLIGTEPIPGIQWRKEPHPMARSQQVDVRPVLPSDHFGLVANLRIGQ